MLKPTLGNAQVSIITPYPVPAGNLTRGGSDTSELYVKIAFGSQVCSNVVVTVTLANGVVYVPGSVAKESSSLAGSSIAPSSNTSTTAPSFVISGMNSSGDFTFKIKRSALCGPGGSFKDGISVTSSCGTISETNQNINKYDIAQPSLSLITPSLSNATVDDISPRTITIANGGNGALDTVDFYVVLPSSNIRLAGGTTNTLIANLSSNPAATYNFTPVRTQGDSLFYRFYGPLLGSDLRLTNGEAIQILERDSVISCGEVVISYGASWGRNKNYCQTRPATAKVTTAIGIASITTKTTISPALTGCIAPDYTITDTFILNTTSAPVSYSKFQINGVSDYTNVILDTNSIAYSVNGGASFTQVPLTGPNRLTVVNRNSSTAASCLTGKARSAAFTLGRAIQLNPGDKLVIRYKVITSCRNTASCPTSTATLFSNYQVVHEYVPGCDTETRSTTSNSQTTGYPVSLNSTLIQNPAQVGPNQNFSLRVPVNITNFPSTSTFGAPARLGSVSFTLPAGVNFISANELQDTGAIRVVRTGQVVTVFFKPNATTKSHYLNFNLQSAGACGDYSLSGTTRIVLDSTCAASEQNVATSCFSTSNPIRFRCATGPCVGISGTARFTRSSFGLPDNNADGIPDATGSLDFQKVDTTRLMIGDTLRSSSRGKVIRRSSSPNFANGYAEWNFSSGTWAPAGNATITLVRGGTRYVCTTAAISNVVTGNTFRVQLNNATGCFANLSGTNLQDGDSIYATAFFRLSGTQSYTNAYTLNSSGSGYNNQTVRETRITHRLFAMDGTPAANAPAVTDNTGSNGYLCDTIAANTYIAGWQRTMNTNNGTAAGCGYATQTITSTGTTLTVSFSLLNTGPLPFRIALW